MVFVGQETQLSKICSHSNNFCDPLLFMKKLCDPQIFHDPLSIRKSMTAPLSLSHTKTLDVCGSLTYRLFSARVQCSNHVPVL